MAVFGHEQHHVSHKSGTPEQRAMTPLVTCEVSTRQTVAQQPGLSKGEAETFSGNSIDSARGIAYQNRAVTIHAPQTASHGDRAPLTGSEFRCFEMES